LSGEDTPKTIDLCACVEIALGVWVDMVKAEPNRGTETFPGLDDVPLQSDWENPVTRRG
jgi:hypothetical protein